MTYLPGIVIPAAFGQNVLVYIPREHEDEKIRAQPF